MPKRSVQNAGHRITIRWDSVATAALALVIGLSFGIAITMSIIGPALVRR